MAEDNSDTGRLLVALAGVAGLVMLAGIVVVWAFSYGPLG
jgi:hypothetical protein